MYAAITYHGVDEVGAKRGTATKVSVGNPHTSVHHIRGDTLAGGAVKGVALASRGGGTHAGQTGGSVVLSLLDQDLDVRITLDVVDGSRGEDVVHHAIVGLKGHGTPLTHGEGVDLGAEETAAGAALANVALGNGSGHCLLVGVDGRSIEGAVVHHDIAVGHGVGHLGVGNGHSGEESTRLALRRRQSRDKEKEREERRERQHHAGRHGGWCKW